MTESGADGGVAQKIRSRYSQRQVKQSLGLFYSIFLFSMGIAIWQLLALSFDHMMIAIVMALLAGQIGMAIEKWLYEGEQFSYSEYLGR